MKINILWIQTDEFRPDAIGAYGGIEGWPTPHTPNIDTLASRGTLFTAAHCQSPVCVPSRTSILTALYPQDTGVYENDALDLGTLLPAETVAFPQHFAASGYEVTSLGKVHTPPHHIWNNSREIDRDKSAGYERFHPPWGVDVPGSIRLPGPPNAIIAGQYPDGERTPTSELTDWAIDFVAARRLSAEPWLLRVSHLMPHTPVVPPARFRDLFDSSEFPVADARQVPLSRFERLVAGEQQADSLPSSAVRRARADYFGMVAHLDEEIGRLLDALSDLGLEDRTLVVLDSDHGVMLGERGLWQKQMFSMPSWRVPLILAGPGVPAGAVRTDPVELIDRARTLCGLAGLDPHPSWRGLDNFAVRSTRAFGVIGRGETDSLLYPLPGNGPTVGRRAAVVTERFALDRTVRDRGVDVSLRHPIADPVLLDLGSPEGATVNRAFDSSYQPVLEDLDSQLTTWLQDPSLAERSECP